MRIFKISGLSHEFVGKRLFKNAELTVQSGEHIGLVGPNGCGKTSFLRILTGDLVPDAWELETSGELKIGRLDQFSEILGRHTVKTYLRSLFDGLYELAAKADALYESLPGLSSGEQERAINRAARINERLDELGFNRIDKRIDTVLAGLGFAEEDGEKAVSALSGGMKTKLTLARLLLDSFDLLVLDEPTNFLDEKYIGWLGEYLSRLPVTYIVISHDVAFLNRVSGKIVEIANGGFRVYEGDYGFFLKEKLRRDEIFLEQYSAQQKYILRAEAYVSTEFFGGGRKSGKVVRSKQTWMKRMLESMERMDAPERLVKPSFSFAYLRGAGSDALELKSAEVGYGGSPVLPPLSLKVASGEKVVFKGFNGIGKTTLLKSIYGDLPLVSGEVAFGGGIEAVFFRQEEDYDDSFSPFDAARRRALGIRGGKGRELTVMEFMKSRFPEKPNRELTKMLFTCGLTEQHIYARVRTLSGGELTKLRLCVAMASPVNLILLDEPSNHLDPYSREVLESALGDFEGALLMTTHDKNMALAFAHREIDLESLFD